MSGISASIFRGDHSVGPVAVGGGAEKQLVGATFAVWSHRDAKAVVAGIGRDALPQRHPANPLASPFMVATDTTTIVVKRGTDTTKAATGALAHRGFR